MPTTILLIEDDLRIRTLLPRYFVREGMTVHAIPNGKDGMASIEEHLPDVVLLDVNLPDIDGWSILRRIRQDLAPKLAVIMLTGRSDVPDRLLGLDLGADDYIVKPFEPREVVARVKAVLRRTQGTTATADAWEFPRLRIDLAGRAVWREEKPVSLTAKEFSILTTLASKPGHVFSREALYETVWDDDTLYDDHILDVHMNRLRQKLAGDDGITYLVTVRGVGYKFEVRHENS
ncbi:MAG TPA: response regulator transcription factor [Armatimonadota bacterium]|nr:response regulator transcription factor [Armatimonadota bacterium]